MQVQYEYKSLEPVGTDALFPRLHRGRLPYRQIQIMKTNYTKRT